ncbi:MAG: elongation factor P [Candidatus Brocadiia bacterium]
MPMVKGTEIRPGMVLRVDGELYLVVKMTHITPGNWRGIVQTKLKHVKKGTTAEKRFSPEDKLESTYLEVKNVEYIYSTKDSAVFQDLATYEEIEIPLDQVEEQLPYLPLNSQCKVRFIDGAPISVDLPASVELSVVDAPPSVRGDTATNVYKIVKTGTGLEVRCPSHIKTGDNIKVDTRTGEFIERANK